MELEVLNIQGKGTGKKVSLNETIFGIEPNDHCIYLDVKAYLAAQRQGTAKSKERAEISGSTRKIKKQKGSGTARAGSIKSGVFRGGGRIFGPKPKDWSIKLNKKVKQLARRSVLTYRAQDNRVLVLENFDFEGPKTKQYIELLNNLKVSDKKTLLVLPEGKKNVLLSSRNIKNAEVAVASDLNTYQILNANNLLIVEESLAAIDNVLSTK